VAASAALLTDIATIIAAGPSTTTAANAAAGLSAATYPSGGINDYVGNLALIQTKLKELKELYTMLHNVTDAGDGNAATLNNAILTLS